MNVTRLHSASATRSCLTTSLLHVPQAWIIARQGRCRGLATAASNGIPLRKHLKDEAKRKKAEGRGRDSNVAETTRSGQNLSQWELTVGIEIHAELNTACKLFSSAQAVSDGGSGPPNSSVAFFDAALPGAQPQFQPATLLPALRAAIALGCRVQHKSGWDRKHYFHWDQPHGYQITQYYEPFAKDGHLVLGPEDGVPADDMNGASHVRIGIKQIQMEQDTAKTSNHPPSSYHIDLNRAGVPLIEIITLPQIHSPQTASALVRKIQAILRSVDACVTGMELGGLRADVNVSVRKRGSSGTGSWYSGVSGLGQRTEIKNLSSFVAIENAIVAERDRQISVLQAGGSVIGETRGWSLGASETTRLRGKEGEVDYRYMPDADLPSLFIGQDLVDYIQQTLPEMPEQTTATLQQRYGLSLKDAKTLVALDDGDRVEFVQEAIAMVLRDAPIAENKVGKVVSNWVLHELGGLLTTSNLEWSQLALTPDELAAIIVKLQTQQITSRAAKQLLATLHELPLGDSRPSVEQLIEDGNLRLRSLSQEGYTQLAKQIMTENPAMVAAVRDKGQQGKVMWFVGQMVRKGEEGTVEPKKAKEVVQALLTD